MTDQLCVAATALVIVTLIASQVFRRSFDPFEPIWLFLTGYAQVYVIQAITSRDYALRVRGPAIIEAANLRALWALLWFVLVYYSGLGRRLARWLPAAPRAWSVPAVVTATPPLILWGLICSGFVLTRPDEAISYEANFLRQFPFMMLVAAILLIVTGRQPDRPRPPLTLAGVLVAGAYVLIWMFNGKRSHALFGVLTGICAYYTPRFRRPALPILAVTAVVGSLVVSVALGWRDNYRYERSFSGFFRYVGDFDPAMILVNLNISEENGDPDSISYETIEYGGFLLMMDTVPEKSDYDYGENYLRIVTTFIVRKLWPDKPYFGRDQWVNAWITGSEFHRDASFTGPAIGILGATQLNGGALGTFIVLGVLATLVRTAYDYFRLYADCPWAQAWWAVTYYNSWLMVVNDDPFVWFYYLYGFSVMPPMALLWLFNRRAAARAGVPLIPRLA